MLLLYSIFTPSSYREQLVPADVVFSLGPYRQSLRSSLLFGLKFKPESLNHISVSFENAVRTELENDFEVFIGDHQNMAGYSKARVRSEFSSLGVTGFKEYLVDALKPKNESNPRAKGRAL